MATSSEKQGPGSRRRSLYTLLGLGALCLAAAFILGIADNPPGIVLAFSGVIALAAIPVRNWRKTRKFLILLALSLVGFFVFVLLHNFFYALSRMTDIQALKIAMNWLEVVSFLAAIFLAPAGSIIGVIGSLFTWIRRDPAPA